MAQSPEDRDPDEYARELYENGLYQFENGQYEQAITAWQTAYELSERHRLVYNIASAQERLGLWQEALDSLTLYRTYAPREEWTALERRIVNIERRIAAANIEATAQLLPEEERAESDVFQIQNIPAFSLVTGASISLSTGLVLGLRAQNTGIEAAAECVAFSSGALCPSSVSHLVQRQQRLALGSDIATGLGLLAASTGVIFYLRDRESDLVLRPSLNGLVLMGSL